MKRIFGLAIVAALWSACSPPPPRPAEPTKLVIGTVWAGAAWDRIGHALAAAYSERLPSVRATATPSGNLDKEIAAFERHETDLAILDVETAYFAFSAEPHEEETAQQASSSGCSFFNGGANRREERRRCRPRRRLARQARQRRVQGEPDRTSGPVDSRKPRRAVHAGSADV